MPDPVSNADELQAAIQQSLQTLAEQMGESITVRTAQQIYQEAVELLSHLDYAPITLARVAGTLLVYRVQQSDAEELAWLREQIRSAPDPEIVEEVLESLSRVDSL